MLDILLWSGLSLLLLQRTYRGVRLELLASDKANPRKSS